jgi:negative regulator of flagellin synthesis FlgM
MEKRMIVENGGIDQIDQNLINKANESQSEKPRTLAQEQEVENKSDKLELSSNAITLNNLSDKAKSIPDVNQEKIDRIHKAIDNGTYEVSSQKIADKIIDEGLGLLE